MGELRFVPIIDPDLAMAYHKLPDPFTFRIPVKIQNNEVADLYFRITLVTPPPEYSDYTQDLGVVSAGSYGDFFWNITRVLPTARVTDALTARIEAYTDPGYTDFWGAAEVSFNLHLFDPAALTLVDKDTFELDLEGWSGEDANVAWVIERKTDYVYEGVCSLRAFIESVVAGTRNKGIYKSFTIPVATMAFLVLHVYYLNPYLCQVDIAGVTKMPAPAFPGTGAWYRLVFLLPTDATVTVRLYDPDVVDVGAELRLDEVWVVYE